MPWAQKMDETSSVARTAGNVVGAKDCWAWGATGHEWVNDR